MILPVDVLQALVGGVGAAFTPGAMLSLVAVVAAGASLGARLTWSRHAVVVAVFVALVVAATSRRGVGAEGLASTVAGLAAFAALFVLLRSHDASWVLSLFGGLLVGVVAVLWRVETFGPVLAELRGPWQSAPDTGRLAIYHFGTGLVWAALYVAAAASGRRLGSRGSWIPWASVGLVAGVLVLSGQWTAVVRVLLLKWPVTTLG